MTTRLSLAVLVLLTILVPATGAHAQPLTGLNTNNGLFTFDSATPGTTTGANPVTGLGANENLIAIDRNPSDGVLYGLARDQTNSNARVYRIAANGAATAVGPVFSTPITTNNADFDFEPPYSAGVARIVTDTDLNIQWSSQSVSQPTGQTGLSYAAGDPRAATNPIGVGLAYTQNYPGGQAGTAYVYDWASPDTLAILGTAGQPLSGNTGQLTSVGPSGVSAGSASNVGLDAAPDGTVFASLNVLGTTRLYTANKSTGAVTPIAPIGNGSDTVRDIATNAVHNTFSLSAGSYEVSESDGKLTVTINRSQSFGTALVRLTTSDGSATASAFSDYGGFNNTILFTNGETSKTVDIPIRSDAIDESSETFSATLSQPTGGVADLGTSTAVGQINDDDSGPVTNTRLTALTIANELVSFETGSPDNVSAPQAITGLPAGESIVGIDRRPANGRLYAVSNQSRLYLVDEGSGAATPIGGPFSTPLTGAAWGIDFSPVGDRLRIVSLGTGQNLRVNPDTGSVVVDGQTTYAAGDQFGSQSVGGAALGYTNNVPGATSTTIYGYDYSKDVVFRLGGAAGASPSPNTGTSFSIGKRTFVAQSAGNVGLDIAPDGNAWALIRDDGLTRLHLLDLSTGIPALVGTIGNGSDTLRDIAAPPVSNTIALSTNGYSGGEADGSVTVTAARSQTRGVATVHYATGDGSAAAGSDYTASSGTVTFEDGEASKTFSIPVADDAAVESAETFTVTLSDPAGGVASLGEPAAATVTLGDNDGGAQQSPADTTKPVVAACGAKTQDIAKAKRVAVCFTSNEAGDGDTAAKVKIAGSRRSYSLARVKRSVVKGTKRTISLTVPKKALKAVRAAVKKRKKVTVTATIRVRDGAKNQTVVTRKIAAKLPARRR